MTVQAGTEPIVLNKRLQRRPLHTDLVEALRDMILDGQFSVRGRIPERDLCERFGVSRTPMREALKVLASANLIRLEHNRGAHLPVLSPKQVSDLFEVLAGYEGVVGSLAAARADDREIDEIVACHARMRAHFEADEREEYFRLNQQIHRGIVASTRNEVLIDLYNRCAAQIAVARYGVNSDRGRWSESMAEHELMLDALQRRDANRLSTILRAHAEATAASTLGHMLAGARRR